MTDRSGRARILAAAIVLAGAGIVVPATSSSAVVTCENVGSYRIDNATDRIYVKYTIKCSGVQATLNAHGWTYRNGYRVCDAYATRYNATSVTTTECPIYDPPQNDKFEMNSLGTTTQTSPSKWQMTFYHS